MGRNLFGALALLLIVQGAWAQAVWWNSSYPYRVAVNVSTSSYDRTDWIVERSLNFSALIYNATGSIKGFDNNSVRVIEYTSGGSIINSNNNLGLISQFDPAPNYNSTSNAIGDVVWMLNGTTPASSTRFFYLYFSDTSRPKGYPNYQTNLSYSWDGRELGVNNSKMQMRMDTAHGSTNTSGIYFVRLNSTTVFDASGSDRPSEYISYWNDAGTSQYTYDLRGSASVLVRGPLRIVVEQKGQEAVWNAPDSKTNEANLTKRYSFYEGQTYVSVNQTLKNTAGADIGRGTWDLIPTPAQIASALALEVYEQFGIFSSKSSSEPGGCAVGDPANAWIYAYPDTGSRGVGIVNYYQSTLNYGLGVSDDVNRVGLTLDATTISSGSTISQYSYLQFDTTGGLSGCDPTQKLWRRTVDSPITVSPANSESWNLSFSTFTNYSVYNRNETVFVYLNLTDSRNVIDKVNATFDMGTPGTSDDSTIQLSEVSTNFFRGQFTPNSTAQTGQWNYTVKLYDTLSQLVNATTSNFTLTSQYNVNLTVLNPFGPVLDRVLANISIINYRNDTMVPGASFTCDYNSTLVADAPTDYGNGKYLLNFTSSSTVGNFTLTCTAGRGGNNGTAFDFYYREAQTTNVLDIQLPQSYTANNITHNTSETFYFNITLGNSGFANAYSLNLSLSAPSGWSLNSSYESCGNVSPVGSCMRLFSATIPTKTLSGVYSINSTAFWRNANGSFWNSTNSTVVTVSSNRILYVLQNNYSANISHGTARLVGNVTVFSYGNDPLLDINFSTVNLSGFPTLFNPAIISTLSSGLNFTVSFNTSVPVGFDPGVYSGFVNVTTSNDGYVEVPYLLEVPLNRSWWRDVSTCTAISTSPVGFANCTIIFNNTGNANITFQAFPNASNYTNYTAPSPDNFTVLKQGTFSVQILYDATGVNTEDTFNTTYTFSALEPEAIPLSQQVRVSLTTRLGPVLDATSVSPAILQQLDGLSVFIRVFDRGQNGINRTLINITTPSGISYLANMTNTTPYSAGYNYSNWTVSFPDTWGNTTEKGFYSLKIKVWDNYNAFNEFSTTFMVYTNLNVSLNPMWAAYSPKDDATILYKASEIDSVPIQNVAVNLTVQYPMGFVRKYNFITEPNGWPGEPLIFSIPSDSPGTYNITAVSRWMDPDYNVSVNKTHFASFVVSTPSSLSADLITESGWLPGNVSFAFIIKQKENLNEVNTDPDWLNFTILSQNLAVVYNTSLNISELVALNKSADAVRDSAGFYLLTANLSALPVGIYFAELKTGKGSNTASRVASFRITSNTSTTESLFADVETTVVWYPNNIMLFDMNVFDLQGGGVDPDNLTLTLLKPDRNQYLFTYYPNSPPSANITRLSKGRYFLQYSMSVNTSTGAYLAEVWAKKGSIETRSTRYFRVASGGPYDVRIKLLQSEVALGNMLPVEFIAENKGEVGQDIIMDYWISDGSGGTWYSVTGEPGYTPVLQNTTFPKSIPIFSNQPLGISYITLVVKYDNTQPTIRVNTTFMVVEANASGNVTPPPTPGPGGGGGAPSAPVIISNVTNVTFAPALVPRLEFTSLIQEVNVERGSERYAAFTLKNTGEKILHNLTLDFSGILFDWYAAEPAKVNTLKVGESTSFMVKFHPLPNAEPKEYLGKVRADSDEVSASQEFKIRLFSSKEELIQYEINQLYEKLDSLRKKADDAQAAGKNVTEAYSLLDEGENQLGFAERYVDKRMHSNALIVINTIDNLFERAGYIIDTSKFTPVAPQQTISIVTSFPDWVIYLLLLIILLIVIALLYWMRQTKDMERLLVTRGTGEIKSAVMDAENLQALEAEKDRIKQFLRTLDREFENNLVSHESYEELRKKNRDRLLALSVKIYGMKESMRRKD